MRVLIIDDHPLFVDGLSQRLKKLDRRTALSRAASVPEALVGLARGPQPDLILLDISLPGLSGLKGIPALNAAAPSSPVVLLSAVDDPLSVREGLHLGVQGFLSKSVPGRDMLAALRKVLAGETVVLVPTAAQGGPSLPPRQRQVLALLAEGLPNKAIAERLRMAPGTVRTHLASIFRALGANTRTQAVVQAQRLGLLGHD